MTASETLDFWLNLDPQPSGFVYVIQGEPDSPIKIGYARDPLKRLATLQTGNPQQLHLRAVVPAGPDFEQHLHQRANRAHLRGEWFHGAYADYMLVLMRGLAKAMTEHCLATGEVPNPHNVLAESVHADRPHRDRRDLWPKISSLWLDGFAPREIGEKLGLGYDDIHHILRVMRDQGGYELARGSQRVRDDHVGGTKVPLSYRRGNRAARRI